MAIQRRASSFSSSSATRKWTHDVFLSFRGEDTRPNFTGHLYNNLNQKGINTFIDDELTRGEEISDALLQAIEGSKISLIVFSENYASSKWCLDELVHILKCRRPRQQTVWPIFYKVDPADVRYQRGNFGHALANHERNFKDDMDKVLGWRTALTETANLAGWHFSNGYEYKLINEIVEGISAQLKELTYLDLPKCLVGLDSRVQHVLERLDVGGSDVRMVGIWGTGGIGKTTIAKAVYNSIAQKFDRSCFLANVKEESEVHGRLLNLQNILLSEFVGGNKLKVNNVDEGITLLCKELRHKRILLVLDDVNKQNQLNKLAGAADWFGPGSRIIITTRDNHLLRLHNVNPIYKAKELDHDEACKLFSSFAFKNNENLGDNEKLSVSIVVRYAQGLPLALTVLGSHLCGRPIHRWQAELDGYKIDPNEDIQKVLKISYDELEQKVKEVFLDIACFFKGRKKDDVIQILESCDRINPTTGIEVLEEKALIHVECGDISIHDLLEDMGKKIVRDEDSPKEPGERKRLWYYKDVLQVLTKNTGTNKIEGIIIKMPTADEIRLNPKCFKRMENLKIFINVNARFYGKVDYYPEQLRILEWPEFLLQSLPSNFNMNEVIQLSMPRSRLLSLGEGFKPLQNLKSMNFEECKFLTEIPDLSGCPNLERMDLGMCESLVEVHSSVGFLENLVHLDLGECSNLVKLPRQVKWRSLSYLNLGFCSSLESFPEIVGEMKCSTELSIDLSGCRNLVEIPQLPSHIKYLVVRDCVSLERISNMSKILEGEESQMIKGLNWTNCCRLIENLVKEANDDCEAVEVLFRLFLSCWKSNFTINFPGREIPKWFSCQMDFQVHHRFEFFIEILPNFKWENTGLALCVLKPQTDDHSIYYRCDVYIYINEDLVLDLPIVPEQFDDSRLDHVLLHYIPFLEMGRLHCEPPFKCRVIIFQQKRIWPNQPPLYFKSCGVHLVMPPDENVCMKLSHKENLTSEHPIDKDDDVDDYGYDSDSDSDSAQTEVMLLLDDDVDYSDSVSDDGKIITTDAQLEN